jgi:hypothetical protein
MSRRAVALLAVVLVSCAGTQSATSTTGAPRAARPADCQLLMANLEDLNEGGQLAGKYEPVGSVTVSANPGATATDPNVKAEVRTKACSMGGEVIVLVSSMEQLNGLNQVIGQQLMFMVFATKKKGGPVAY